MIDVRDIRAAVVYEQAGRPRAIVSAVFYSVPIDCAHFDLALLWLFAREHAERMGCPVALHLTCDDRGRSVALRDPPLACAERARSDDAHADTVWQALDMLTR